MLIIHYKNELPTDKINSKFPWYTYRFDEQLSDNDIKIIETIEQTKVFNDNTIQNRFSGTPVCIENISSGCKTLLAITKAIRNNEIDKYVFNLTNCGSNAISYLATEIAKDIDIHAYLSHTDLGTSKNCHIKIGNETFTDATKAYDKLAESFESYYN